MNSPRKTPGPKQTDPGNVYVFAHQAYWGFRFLSERRKGLWEQVLDAETVDEIQEVGQTCSQLGAMAGAGYGAAGLMTWLKNTAVAGQVLMAKQHRRYPSSERPSSRDRRMAFLAIAVAAGVWEIELSTALRKLAQAGCGLDYMQREVHRFDHLRENIARKSIVWAEPVDNYFVRLPNGKWELMGELPCRVPAKFQGGFIIHGYGPKGPLSVFSRTLPTELANAVAERPKRMPIRKVGKPRRTT